MDISAIANNSINPPEDTSDTLGDPKDKSALTSDFETFLRMLTVQLQNQDPLNPVEASDYAVQLATFSGVEQQVKTNDLLTGLGDQLGLMGLSQFAGWVGMEARYDGAARFTGAPIEIDAVTESAADEAYLVVRNANDTVVSRTPIMPPGGIMQWAGIGSDGLPLPSGDYHFFVENLNAGNELSTNPVPVFAQIQEALNTGAGIELKLASGLNIETASVLGVRTPAPTTATP